MRGTIDEMHVKLIESTEKELLRRIKRRYRKAGLNYDTFLFGELAIIGKIRATLLSLEAKRPLEMPKQAVQMLFSFYM